MNTWSKFLENYQRAYLHCKSVEKTGAFDDSVDWLQCVGTIFEEHSKREECKFLFVILVEILNLNFQKDSNIYMLLEEKLLFYNLSSFCN